MKLIPNNKLDLLTKNKIETVQKKKVEYKLLGTFSRTKGLQLFSYSSISGKIKQLNIKYSKQVVVIPDGFGGLTYYDPERQKVNIDSKNIHFEALNYTNAVKRVKNFKEGKIKELFNLKPKTQKTIEFY